MRCYSVPFLSLYFLISPSFQHFHWNSRVKPSYRNPVHDAGTLVLSGTRISLSRFQPIASIFVHSGMKLSLNTLEARSMQVQLTSDSFAIVYAIFKSPNCTAKSNLCSGSFVTANACCLKPFLQDISACSLSSKKQSLLVSPRNAQLSSFDLLVLLATLYQPSRNPCA
jgi:hypothetical protein